MTHTEMMRVNTGATRMDRAPEWEKMVYAKKEGN
jgi:hypothetical protein